MNGNRMVSLTVALGAAFVLLLGSTLKTASTAPLLELTPTAYNYLPLVLRDYPPVCTPTVWYRDADGDGYGDPGDSVAACSQPAGYVADNSDCDDGDPDVHPGAAELCNDVDDDCDIATADGSDEVWLGWDCDGPDSDLCPEGVFECVAGAQACSDETDDTLEICDNSIDDDCDGNTDEEDCIPASQHLLPEL